MKRSRHRALRAKAWASRWKWPLWLGGASAVLLMINARSAAAAESHPGSAGSAGGSAPGLLPRQAGTQNIPELPGATAPTATQISSAQDFWDTLTAGAAPASGYINFPSGSQAAAALFDVRYDGYGSPYVQWAGQAYILTGPDASGNLTATRVMV